MSRYPALVMFIGEYHHAIDAKGRLAVPAKFRAELEKGAVVTKGVDHCLTLYTMSECKEQAEKISKLSTTQANTRAYARHMLAGAMDVQLDKQGRIILPDYLRAYAGLSKKTVLTGLYNRLEIWDKGVWEEYKTKTEEESGDIAEALGELGV